jgi:hypothetical protein
MIAAVARINLLCFFFLPLLLWAETPKDFCFFIPPKNWTLVNPSLAPSNVKIAFIAKEKKSFCPSLNFVTENTSLNLSEYLQAVRSLHIADKANRWRILGPLHTKAGKAVLTEIDTETPKGKARLLQAILLKNSVAYILTAALSQETFGLFQKEVLESFRSLSITNSFDDSLSSPEKLALFQEKKELFSEGLLSLQTMQDFLSSKFPEEGPYWQFLALQNAQSQKK